MVQSKPISVAATQSTAKGWVPATITPQGRASGAIGPSIPAWSVGVAGAFYGGPTQCGAFRTRDNTTLITLTSSGTLFEVNSAGATIASRTLTGSVARVPRYRLVNGVWVGP